MIAVRGRCTRCKKVIDIMDPGIVCSKCEKYYHAACIEPSHNIQMLQSLVLNNKNWYCIKCFDTAYQVDRIRSVEDKAKIEKRIDLLFELRTILSMIDTSMSIMTDKCDELQRNAEELRSENSSLRKRIFLHKIHGGEIPKDFIDWHAKRKLLQIKGRAQPTKRKIPKTDEAIAKKKALFSYVEKNHNWKRFNKHKDKKTMSLPVIQQAIKQHRIGKPETAVFLSQILISRHAQKWWHQVLMIIIVLLYTLFGGVVFYVIEGLLHELTFFDKIETKRDEIYKKLQEMQLVVSNVLIEKQLLLNRTTILMVDYFDFVQDIINEYDDKASLLVEEMAWNFIGSVIFSATTCMTIGYGNIRPVTALGKILTIVYAIVGIPLFLILLSTLGKTVITQLRLLLHKIKICKRSLPLENIKRAAAGLTLKRALFPNFRIENNNEWMKEGEHRGPRSKSRATLGTIYIDFNEEEHPNLPFWLVFILEIAYILIGAAIVTLFDVLNFLQSFCFVFESLTTVGFGTYIPQSNNFMLVFILYIIGGITITVVGIHVTEDLYRKRIGYATHKLGIHTENYIEQHLS